jgi:hypothetical protein
MVTPSMLKYKAILFNKTLLNYPIFRGKIENDAIEDIFFALTKCSSFVKYQSKFTRLYLTQFTNIEERFTSLSHEY